MAHLHQHEDHRCAGFGMTEGLEVQVVQESADGCVVSRVGHAMDVDGLGFGDIIGLDIGAGDEQFADKSAGIGLLDQVASQ